MWDGKSAAEVALLQGEQTSAGNRDFILEYSLLGRQIESGLLLYEGSDENFFLLMAQPPKTVAPQTIPPRDYIFVMDVSGSMNGFPISVSKQLLQELIGGLKPTDTFNVILFAGASSAMAEKSLPATRNNIRTALNVIDKQQGGGGTALAAAMRHALGMPQEENVSRSIVIITDGYISAEKEAFNLIRDNLNRANVFAFGIGSSVNRYLIEGIARAGKGEPFIVTDKNEAAATAAKLREYIESPVLTGISLHYDGFQAYAVEPAAIPDLMAKRPLQIIGKWKGNRNGSITIKGTNGDGPYEQSFDVESAQSLPEHRSLRYLWARTRVAELADFSRISANSEIAREITSLGLTYDLLTEYTSFIAVYEKIRNESGQSTDVTQPLPLPQGVSDLAVGGEPPAYSTTMGVSAPVSSVPEPGLTLLLLIAAMTLFVSFVRTAMKQRRRRVN
jgi:Ca-activated chloride channel family protein